ncbi:MAG: HlyD family efflux transporter periplasmic adaptor subunit [Phycisphaerales bacterium]|nr:HlyD family efflux transporter periplasmic adaptor subunit [Phycisphaerales bacterium]
MVVLGLMLVGVSGATWAMLRGGGEQEESVQRDLRTVERGRFDVVIPASGELAALKQIEIVNALEAKAVVTEIIPEGTIVKPGDVLFRLADEELRDKIKDAEDAVKTAEANLSAATSSLAVKKSSAASELAKAVLDIELARLALQSWENGELKAKRQELDLAIEKARINFERLEAKLGESEKLFADGHISRDELERDRIEKIQSEADVKKADLDKVVYESYQFLQDQKKKNSDLEQAQSERERVEERNQAEINNATVALASAQYKLTTARERLEKFQRQLEACVAVAPSGGLVVYATSIDGGNRWGGRDEKPLQVGSELSPNQTVIILPDTSQMIANVKVNEALTGRIRPGQRVNVVSDAHPNAPIPGEVLSVGVLAESAGWRDPNRRDYTVRVALDTGRELGLKPSMRCKVEIIVDTVEDALHIPIQSVYRKGPLAFVYVADGSGFAQREVQLGRSSELEVEVRAGLEPGEVVLLREPAPEEIVSKIEDQRREPPVREAAGSRQDEAPAGRPGRPGRAAGREGSGPTRPPVAG